MCKKVETMIQRHEGLRHFVYKCPTGRYTIGYGRNVDVAGGKGLSVEESEYLLRNDIQKITAHLTNAIPVFHELNDARRAVLINMGYNLGMHGLMNFKLMLRALAHKDFNTAADEMIDSKWATQVKIRATELAQVMSTGKFIYE